MKRSDIESVKADAHRLLKRISEMERCAGWHRYGPFGNEATEKPHKDDIFNGGQFTAAVKRASMDLSRSLVEVRR